MSCGAESSLVDSVFWGSAFLNNRKLWFPQNQFEVQQLLQGRCFHQLCTLYQALFYVKFVREDYLITFDVFFWAALSDIWFYRAWLPVEGYSGF